VAGRASYAPIDAVHFFVFTVIVLITVIGGRVIPSFTANALRGVRQFRNRLVDALTLAATALALLMVLLGAPTAATTPAAGQTPPLLATQTPPPDRAAPTG
ncbi:MAG: NnrS family protein, partial [Gemmatimonadaceae bacterium]|nr:NnrS family protein [Gemmatimonadaceae bacterium]